jgi:polyisoprenoid-binding protein YceI
MAKRHWKRWALIGAAVVVVLAVGGPFLYIHLIEGTAAPKLALPKNTTTTASGSSTASTAAVGINGTWSVGSGSVAGYRVDEVLIGQHATAVGRTSSVTGHLTLSGADLTAATFSVAMDTVKSDQSQRNAQFDGRIMDVSQFPTATFTLSKPVSLGSVPAVGTAVHLTASGELKLHGVTKPITLTISAERTSTTELDVLADGTVVFAHWNISNPSIGGFVTTANQGTLEVLLHLSLGAASPSGTTTTTIGVGASTGGGPPTIPSTTVPPLNIGG